MSGLLPCCWLLKHFNLHIKRLLCKALSDYFVLREKSLSTFRTLNSTSLKPGALRPEQDFRVKVLDVPFEVGVGGVEKLHNSDIV